MPQKSNMDPQGRFKFLNIWISRLNNIDKYIPGHFIGKFWLQRPRSLPTFFGLCLELKIWSPISFPHLFLLKQLWWGIAGVFDDHHLFDRHAVTLTSMGDKRPCLTCTMHIHGEQRPPLAEWKYYTQYKYLFLDLIKFIGEHFYL